MTITDEGNLKIDMILVDYVEHVYSLEGTIPSVERAVADGANRLSYQRHLKTKRFKDMLKERGIEFKLNNTGISKNFLTGDQLRVAQVMMDVTDTRSSKKKLQDLGISTARYNAMLKDPVFKAYLSERSSNLLEDYEHEVNIALMDRIRAGDFKAIEYYNELTGRFTRARSGSGSANVDPHYIISKILEIIDQNVKDPDTQYAISNAIEGLVRTQAVTTLLLDDRAAMPVPAIATGKTTTVVSEAPAVRGPGLHND